MKWMPEPPEQPTEEEILRRVEAFRKEHGREGEPQELWPELFAWRDEVERAADLEIEREDRLRTWRRRFVLRISMLFVWLLFLGTLAFLAWNAWRKFP